MLLVNLLLAADDRRQGCCTLIKHVLTHQTSNIRCAHMYAQTHVGFVSDLSVPSQIQAIGLPSVASSKPEKPLVLAAPPIPPSEARS